MTLILFLYRTTSFHIRDRVLTFYFDRDLFGHKLIRLSRQNQTYNVTLRMSRSIREWNFNEEIISWRDSTQNYHHTGTGKKKR